MASKMQFTDVSMFDFEIDKSLSEKIKNQKQEILRFFESQKGENINNHPITISAHVDGNKIIFTLMEEIPIV